MATRQSDAVLAAARDYWQLPDDEREQLLTLSRVADRMELKLTVPATAHDATCAALGVDFTRIPASRVYYLDTKDRALDRHGVVARVRSINHRPDDSVIKLRPVSPGSIPPTLRHSKQFVVEGVDLSGPQQTKTRATLDFFSTHSPSARRRDTR